MLVISRFFPRIPKSTQRQNRVHEMVSAYAAWSRDVNAHCASRTARAAVIGIAVLVKPAVLTTLSCRATDSLVFSMPLPLGDHSESNDSDVEGSEQLPLADAISATLPRYRKWNLVLTADLATTLIVDTGLVCTTAPI